MVYGLSIIGMSNPREIESVSDCEPSYKETITF